MERTQLHSEENKNLEENILLQETLTWMDNSAYGYPLLKHIYTTEGRLYN